MINEMLKMKTEDKINHPNHYQGINNLEVLEVHENFLPKYDKYGALVGAYIFNAIKYILRAPDKNGIEDLKKARFYLDEVIKHLEDNQ